MPTDKLTAAPALDSATRGRKRSWSSQWLALCLIIAVAVVWKLLHATHLQPAVEAECATDSLPFNWEAVVPSTTLKWVTCYGDKECARFAVPLDYAQPSGPQAAIAVLRLPSKYTSLNPEYRGPILFNFGGPGGAGVERMVRSGDSFRKLLGEDYDIVAFDPRGVGFTTPPIRIFNTSEEASIWSLHEKNDPLYLETPGALARGFARWSLFGDLALERTRVAAEYASSAMVSRDMLHITRAFGYEKLKYWGFSYGSHLGVTYASMFPHHVERLVLDGVLDSEDYIQDRHMERLYDADAIMTSFFEACVDAGPEACVLHAASPSVIRARAANITAQLKRRPLPVVSDHGYGLVDYRLLREILFHFLYAPYGPAPWTTPQSLSLALVAAEAGDGRLLWELAEGAQAKLVCPCGEDRYPGPQSIAASIAIKCGESDAFHDSLDELQTRLDEAVEFSTFAELTYVRLFCAGWKIRAKERYEGPFTGNTSFPILFIGNTADPVTPLRNAQKMAASFKDAVLLHQKSVGHCSTSAVSMCTAKTVRDYFRRGDLPSGAARECEVESRMFGQVAILNTTMSSEDIEVWEAWQALHAGFQASPLLPF